jgi:type I restriction enzyme S subunit
MIFKLQRLGDVARVFNGKTPSKAEQRDIGHSVLKIKDVSEVGEFRGKFESFVDESLAEKHIARWIKAGDSLILNAAHNAEYVASKMFLANERVAGVLPTGEWLIARPNESVLLPQYLHYWVKSESTRRLIRSIVKGIHLYPKDVAELMVSCPPLDEQRRIVDILSRAEGIARLRREAQKKAAELIPALFLDMFGDPATNPKGWPMRKVSDFVARFVGGKNIQAGSENGSNFRILKVSAVTSGVYRESESKPAPDGYAAPTTHIVRKGDLLFSRANTVELVGATALVEDTNGTTLLPDKLWRFVWAEPIEPHYVYALFQNAYVRRELGKLSSGTSASMRNISQAKLFALTLPVASIKIQRAFAERAEQIRSIQSQQISATQKAEATFDALLAQVFH